MFRIRDDMILVLFYINTQDKIVHYCNIMQLLEQQGIVTVWFTETRDQIRSDIRDPHCAMWTFGCR